MSRPDDLLDQLGRLARQEATDSKVESSSPQAIAPEIDLSDPRWDALVAGQLSPGECETLRLEAMATEAGRRAWEAFRPLDVDIEPRIIQRVVQLQSEGRSAVSLWRRSSYGRVLAALAAVLLVVLGYRFSSFKDLKPPADPLVTYSLEVDGAQAFRSSGATSPVFVEGTSFEIRLRPERDFTGRVDVHLFFTDTGSEIDIDSGAGWQPWQAGAMTQIDPQSGAARISGVMGEALTLAPGTWTLAAVIGREHQLPSSEQLLERLKRGERSGQPAWQLLMQEIEVRGSESP